MTTPSQLDDAGSNWAGTFRYRAQRIETARSLEDVVGIVAKGGRVKVLGSRHSFNDVADTTGTLVDLGKMYFEPRIDEDRRRVKVPARMSYGTLGRFLQVRGWALSNLGSLPQISVAGACATGTHGSGVGNQSLAAAVCGMELVVGRGRRVLLTDEDPRFLGGVVALGAIGIATSISLRIEPSYAVRQDVFVNMPWAELEKLDGIMETAYSVSLFTRWNGVVDQVWIKSRVEKDGPEPIPPSGSTPADGDMSPVESDHDNATVQCGVPGSWNDRLPHFRFDETPSNGNEIQSEYFVARKNGLAALRALEPIASVFSPHLLICELRSVAADQLWLSPAFNRDSLTIHFTWKNRPLVVSRLLPLIEEALGTYDARPHWGKWFSMDSSDISVLYPRLPEFVNLAREFDPDGQFRNEYLSRVLALN
jgi:xylitol oxidase